MRRVIKPTTERHYQSKKGVKISTSEKKSTPVYSKMKSEHLVQHDTVSNQPTDSRGKARTVYYKQKSQIVCVDQILNKAGDHDLHFT